MNSAEILSNQIKDNIHVRDSGIFELVLNGSINKYFETSCEWRDIESSGNNQYTLPQYGDYISTFQIYNSTNELITIKLKIDDSTIGNYDINPGVNNIIPVYGNPGLMVGWARNSHFYFESEKLITIKALWTFISLKSPMHLNTKSETFQFVGPQGAVFEINPKMWTVEQLI